MQEVQEGTTSTEFCEWMKYNEIEVNSFHREDFFMAQLAAEVRRTIAKEPSNIQCNDFLLTFETAKRKEPAPLTEEQKALKLSASKAYWMNLGPPKSPPA